jgi:hypothetical protein
VRRWSRGLGQQEQPAARAGSPLPRDLTVTFGAMRAVADKYGETLTAVCDLTRFEQRVFSQNGEDGVIAELLARVGVSSRWFVEFGIGPGVEGNCVLLADVFGWSGLFLESDDDDFRALEQKYATNERVRTIRAAVTPDNVNDLLGSNGAPHDIDVLSIDIDGHDYWVWRAIRSFTPRVVVIEYNSSLDPDSQLVKPLEASEPWDGTTYYGASLGALCAVANDQGYTFVYTDLCGVNAFFVRDDLVSAVGVTDHPVRAPNFGLAGLRIPPDPANRAWIDLEQP